jgi:alpha-tubulin suppressor-like RCC1 family protein
MGDSLPPIDLGTGRTAQTIVAGQYHTCALLDDSSLKCWGENDLGQLGQGDPDDRGDDPGEMGDNLKPIDLGTGRHVISVGASVFGNCALLDDGSVKCWGSNSEAQLGLGDFKNRGDEVNQMGDDLPAIDLGTGKRAVYLSADSGVSFCAILADGSLKCWGNNGWGQLGLGDYYTRGVSISDMGDALPVVDVGF